MYEAPASDAATNRIEILRLTMGWTAAARLGLPRTAQNDPHLVEKSTRGTPLARGLSRGRIGIGFRYKELGRMG